MRSYIDSTLTYWAFVIGRPDKELSKARRKFLWPDGKVNVSWKRALLPWHKGGLGLVDETVRSDALLAKMGCRIHRDSEMKAYHLVKACVEAKRPIASLSPWLARAYEAWLQHSPNLSETLEVKEIQQHLSAKRGLDN